MKHTPGPWKVCEQYTDRAVYPISHPIDNDNQAVSILAEVNSCGGTKEQCQANARLIAAAPDLLSALEGLLKVAEKQIDQSATHEGLLNCQALANTRVALAKARGDK